MNLRINDSPSYIGWQYWAARSGSRSRALRITPTMTRRSSHTRPWSALKQGCQR